MKDEIFKILRSVGAISAVIVLSAIVTGMFYLLWFLVCYFNLQPFAYVIMFIVICRVFWELIAG